MSIRIRSVGFYEFFPLLFAARNCSSFQLFPVSLINDLLTGPIWTKSNETSYTKILLFIKSTYPILSTFLKDYTAQEAAVIDETLEAVHISCP
jgi:hypothetical protein